MEKSLTVLPVLSEDDLKLQKGDIQYVWASLEPGMGRLPDKRDLSEETMENFWAYQYNWPLEKRISTFKGRLNFYKRIFKNSNELDFITDEIDSCNEMI